VDGTITWEEDPDFGYLVAAEMPDFDDPDLLQPRKLYERQDRLSEYEEIVARLKEDRAAYLANFADLDPVIARSAGV
jgi:phosphoenolpyruvate carboxykinase (ATP)